MPKKAGIIILNEVGLDPGIDHMSAMRIIDKVHHDGGKVEEFYSFCGALPAPESANNPFKYKFSWSPKGVVLAGNNDAKYLQAGKVVDIKTKEFCLKSLSLLVSLKLEGLKCILTGIRYSILIHIRYLKPKPCTAAH